MVTEVQRIDLHVHTKYAGQHKPAALKFLAVDESHTEPQHAYERLLERGMTMVTITDHDNIQGCLEIAHHGSHVFISEEVSARFPENGTIVHVLTYGITEAQHEEMQRLRTNIYELMAYIHAEGILNSLAHPFSSVNGRLTPEQLKKSLLMFETLELINGQKDPQHERFVRDVVEKVDHELLCTWAEELGLPEPAPRDWRLTAGSDDHSGFTMARAYSEFDGPPTFDALSAALRGGALRLHGEEQTTSSYAHTVVVGAFNHVRSSQSATGDSQTFNKVVDIARTRELPDDLEELAPVLQRLIPAAIQALADAPRIPTPGRALSEGHTPEFHDEVYDLVQTSLIRAMRASVGKFKDGVMAGNPDQLVDELPTIIRLLFFNIPYYFGFRFFHGERRRGWALYESLELRDALGRESKAAVFCDTLDNVDGVGLGLRRIVQEMKDDGRTVYLCGAQPDDAVKMEASSDVVRFPTLGHFPILGYESYQIGWPSLLEVMRWLSETEVDLVVATTPGPVGVIAMIAAKILEIPVIGQYHTHVGDFATRILGDQTIGRIVTAFSSWFYGTMAEVAVPSEATGTKIAEQGVRPDRLQVVRRGVDTEAFNPRHADPDFWPSRGLRGKNTLIYAGRVSAEKNMRFLSLLTRYLIDTRGVDIELAVVGDGPMREQLEEELADYPVIFTGYLRGEELATAYASSDLLVFPSTTDTFGNVVIESLASGTPALVTDVGGPSEIVQDGRAGMVLPVDHLDTWAGAVTDIVLDRRRMMFLQRCARTVAEAYTFERARTEQWDFYSGHIDRFRADRREKIR
ncbi:MAG: glycosyltransferase [Myxococcota bacterium]